MNVPPPTSNKNLLAVFLVIAILSGFLGVLWLGLSIDQSKIPSALIGSRASDFQLELVQSIDDSKTIELSKLKGHVVLLNFWASWCHSCKAEAMDLEALWKDFREKGVYVLGVAIQDEASAAKAFAVEFGKNYWLALDKSDGSTAINYGVSGVPESFLIDAQGIIVHKETGPVDRMEMSKKIKELLL